MRLKDGGTDGAWIRTIEIFNIDGSGVNKGDAHSASVRLISLDK